MTTKEQLHQLVDQLPEGAADEASRLLEALRDGRTPEDEVWMDTDLSRLGEFEPYEWGPEGPPEGRPIRYVPGIGPVVE